MTYQQQLWGKVDQLIGKDTTRINLLCTIKDLVKTVEQYKLQETIHLERLKKQDLQIKEMKQKSWYPVYEENLKMALELAELKG